MPATRRRFPVDQRFFFEVPSGTGAAGGGGLACDSGAVATGGVVGAGGGVNRCDVWGIAPYPPEITEAAGYPVPGVERRNSVSTSSRRRTAFRSTARSFAV